jgi:hypothetical protein
MLVDPIPVTASAPNPAYSFAVIKSDGYGSERRDTSTGQHLIFNHTTGKTGDRHYMKMSLGVDAVNPYTGLTQRQTATVSLSISTPPFGFTESAMVNFVKSFTDTLANSNVTVQRVLQFQS